jgi:hypothetical protein
MKTTLIVEKKVTVRVERDEIAKLLREAVKAPKDAVIDFDGSYFDYADLIWSEPAQEIINED